MPLTDNPTRPRNVSGLISNSAFSENAGHPLWEIDPQSGPVNDLRYSANRFNPAGFDDRVYVNTLAAPNGLNTAGLNALTVFRAGRPPTTKTEVPNAHVPNLREGLLFAVPSPSSVGAAPTAPTASLLAYAWTGGAAAIGAAPLQKAGLLEVPPGDYTLMIDGTPIVATKALGSCTSGPFLCLAGNRFRAEVTWKLGAASLPAQAVAVSGDAGYFTFNDPGSAERVVKMVGQNGTFGVFSGGLTNAEHTLTVTDTTTGAVKTYTNAAGAFMSLGDMTAFPRRAQEGRGCRSQTVLRGRGRRPDFRRSRDVRRRAEQPLPRGFALPDRALLEGRRGPGHDRPCRAAHGHFGLLRAEPRQAAWTWP